MKKYPGIYRGKVLATDAAEENKLGRIKVEVYPMLLGKDTAREIGLSSDTVRVEGITIDVLPWAMPAGSLFAGAGNGYGSFAVPKIGSFVYIFFEGGDVYQPVYFAEAQTKLHGLPIERLTDYPHTKVWKTPGGFVITIDDKKGFEEIKIVHPAGNVIKIDKDGNLSVSSTGTTTITSVGNLSVTAPRIDLN